MCNIRHALSNWHKKGDKFFYFLRGKRSGTDERQKSIMLHNISIWMCFSYDKYRNRKRRSLIRSDWSTHLIIVLSYLISFKSMNSQWISEFHQHPYFRPSCFQFCHLSFRVFPSFMVNYKPKVTRRRKRREKQREFIRNFIVDRESWWRIHWWYRHRLYVKCRNSSCSINGLVVFTHSSRWSTC